MKSYVLLASALLANSVFVSSAFADQMVTLSDGKQVLLKDDFTWQYVSNASSNAESALTSIPVAKTTRGTTIKIGDTKPSLQLSKSGVDVLIGAGLYENEQLILPISVTNQSTEAVVLVTLNITVYSPTGELLHQGSINTWQSIKRLADTYLRPQTSAEGKYLAIDVDKYPEYKIDVEITDVSTR